MFLLITATVLSFLSVHSSIIGNLISKWMNKPSIRETELISERRQLKIEQSQLSITDDFAKYSKLQRKIIKIDEAVSAYRSGNSGLTVKIGYLLSTHTCVDY
ncbi:hypothetical protein JTB14_002723 [Gonioctena quinquepunctata]|nr:hypothetical protein JTB14_002723 [Gonioctena quinquepunctata]